MIQELLKIQKKKSRKNREREFVPTMLIRRPRSSKGNSTEKGKRVDAKLIP